MPYRVIQLLMAPKMIPGRRNQSGISRFYCMVGKGLYSDTAIVVYFIAALRNIKFFSAEALFKVANSF